MEIIQKIMQKFENRVEENTIDTFKIGVYSIYDTVLKQFDLPLSIPETKLYDYIAMIVNDVSSKYYGHESDFILNKIGDFNTETGCVETHLIERINLLDAYIDNSQRNLQTIVSVLNYLPQGYFKMPMEQKQAIQEKIDCAVTEYVANYVIPDLDVTKFDTRKIQDIYKRYDAFEHMLDVNKQTIDRICLDDDDKPTGISKGY